MCIKILDKTDSQYLTDRGAIWKIVVKEVFSSTNYKNSFATKGYIKNIPDKDTFFKFIDDGISKIYYLQKNDKIYGFCSVIEDYTKIKDYLPYEHKHSFIEDIKRGLIIDENSIVLADLLVIDEAIVDTQSNAGSNLINKISEDYKDKYLIGFAHIFNGYSIRWLQKNSFKILLKKTPEGPPIFRYRYENHLIYENEEHWVALIKPPIGKQLFDTDKFAFVNLELTNIEPNKDDGWLVDKVLGYLLLSTKIDNNQKVNKKVKFFNYNDFTESQKQDMHYILAKCVQKDDYTSLNEILCCELKNLKDNSQKTQIIIVDIGSGIHNRKISIPKNVNLIQIDKDNPLTTTHISDNIEKIKKADIIIAKSFFSRLFDYEQKMDYELSHKKYLFEEIIKTISNNNGIFIFLEPEVLCQYGCDIDIVKQELRSYKPVKDIDMEEWASFWWYALADNSSIIATFENVINKYKELLHKTKTYGSINLNLRKGKIYVLKSRLNILYRVYVHSLFDGSQLKIEDEPLQITHEKLAEIISAVNNFGYSLRISEYISKFYKENRMSPPIRPIVFLIINDSLNDSDLENILDYFKMNFSSGLIICGDFIKDMQNLRVESFNNEYFPKQINSYLYEVYKILYSKIKGSFSDEERLLSITLCRFIPELDGATTLTQNTMLCKFCYKSAIFFICTQLQDAIASKISLMVRENILKHAQKAAISAIMSRNQSHNLGSHVLATLDKQYVKDNPQSIINFNSYLQRRMDFIARMVGGQTASGEPMYFFADLLDGFFKQNLLLNHLVKDQRGFEKGKIIFKLCLNGSTKPFSVVYKEKKVSSDFSEDEFSGIFTIKGLVNALIHNGVVTSNGTVINSIKDLNEKLLKEKNLYNLIIEKDQTKQPTCRLIKLKVAYDNSKDENDLKKLNRTLLEEYYPNQTPKKKNEDDDMRWQINNPIINDFLVSIPGGEIGCQALYVFIESMMRNSAKYGLNRKAKRFLITIKSEDKGNYYKISICDNLSICNGKIAKEIKSKIMEPLVDSNGQIITKSLGIAEMREACRYIMGPFANEYPVHNEKGVNYPLWVECPGPVDCHKEKNRDFQCGLDNNNCCNHLTYVFHLMKPQMVAVIGNPGIQDNKKYGIKVFDDLSLLTDVKNSYQFVLIYVNDSNKGKIKDTLKNKHHALPYRILIVDDNRKDFEEIIPKRRVTFCSPEEICIEAITQDKDIENFIISVYEAWIRNRWLDADKCCYNLVLAFDREESNSIFERYKEIDTFDCLSDKINWSLYRAYYDEKKNIHKAEHKYGGTSCCNYLIYDNHSAFEKANNLSNTYFHHLIGEGNNKIFETLASPPANDFSFKYFLLSILEASLTKVVIIDERVAEACIDEKKYFDISRLLILNKCLCYPVFSIESIKNVHLNEAIEKKIDGIKKQGNKNKLNKLTVNGNYKVKNDNGLNIDEVDFVIIHYGLIETHESLKEFKKLYSLTPSIVITSGRGAGTIKKDDDNTNNLPFLEASILKDNTFPAISKYHLIRALMSIKGGLNE